MKTFNLTAKVTISIYTEVEADTLKEAIRIAEGRDIEQGEFDGENKSDAWISDEFDGEVQNVQEV